MTEIILSFFAVIGITLLTLHICDFIFFHKFNKDLPLIVDIRWKDAKEVIDIFELITTVRQKASGKAVISRIIILTNSYTDQNSNIAKKYIETFQIPGELYEEGNEEWKKHF